MGSHDFPEPLTKGPLVFGDLHIRTPGTARKLVTSWPVSCQAY